MRGGGAPVSARLADRLRPAPYAALALGVLAVAGYLCLVNLDYAALWHDEAPAALHFERALQLDPRDRQALDHLALVHFRQRRYAMALELYRRLAEVTPDSAQIHANIGSALYYLGRIDEAVGSFEQALALDPALETARSALERIRKAHPRPGS